VHLVLGQKKVHGVEVVGDQASVDVGDGDNGRKVDVGISGRADFR
jgi:hypothetical protein